MIAKSLKLTSLPQDILLLIIHLVDQSDKCTLSRVCKALCIISRPARFQDVEFRSKTAFDKLCDLVQEEDYAPCAGFVRNMTLDFSDSDSEQSLSEPFPRLFPKLAELSVFCEGNLSRTFLESLGGLPGLRSIALDAGEFDTTEPAEFSGLELTALYVRGMDSANSILFAHNVLRGATRKSIAELTILSSAIPSPPTVPELFDPFPAEIGAYPALRGVVLVGALDSTSSRLLNLLPALIALQCLTRLESAFHDGNMGSWEHLENVIIAYNPGVEVDEKILNHAPNLKELELRELSVGSFHNILLCIAGAGMNALRLTHVTLDMTQPDMGLQFSAVIGKDIFESAILAMKNLEHFALLGYYSYEDMALPIDRTSFPWFTSVGRLAKTLSNLHFLLDLQTNMPTDTSESLPNDPEEVPPYVRSKKNEYITLTGVFVANCPSLQFVTWGFRRLSERWLLIPTKKRQNGETTSVSDDVFLSEYPLFDETDLSSYEIV